MPTLKKAKVGSLRLFQGANCPVSSTVVMYPLHSGMGVLLVGDGVGPGVGDEDVGVGPGVGDEDVGVGPGVGDEAVGVGVGRAKGVMGAQAPRSRARPAQAATVVVMVRRLFTVGLVLLMVAWEGVSGGGVSVRRTWRVRRC